jgi:hypothetical protein
MNKSIKVVSLAIVMLTVLMNGCAPASTPVTPAITSTSTLLPSLTLTPTLLPTITPTLLPIDSFVGTWVNVDTNPQGRTKIEITSESGSLIAHFWGACVPTDCDAGSTTAFYTSYPILMILDRGFVIRNFTLSLNGDTLHVTTFSHYTDNSGRPDMTVEEDFRK